MSVSGMLMKIGSSEIGHRMQICVIAKWEMFFYGVYKLEGKKKSVGKKNRDGLIFI